MPVEAFGLALAAAFYPPAVIAMIALVRGDQPRRRLFVYLAGAAVMTFGAGVAMLLLLQQSGAVQRQHPQPSAALEIVLGLAALAIAAWLWRRPAGSGHRDADGDSGRVERFTRSLALVFALGLLMYAPSPLYFGAMKTVADANLSTAANAALVLALGATVLLMVEIPAVLAVLSPEHTSRALVRANEWLRANATLLGTLAFAAGGVYLVVRGLADLI